MISQAFSYLPSSSFQHSARATPLSLFRNLQSSWLSWCTFDGPFRCHLKHVKGKSPGSAESKDANSKWVSSGSCKKPRRGAEFRKVFGYKKEVKNGNGEFEKKVRLLWWTSYKPSFITVDLSNKIVNHVTPNDFIELPFCVDLKLKGRPLPSVTLKNFYCIVLLILHLPRWLFLRNWNTWLLIEITNSNTLFS